MSDNTEDDNEWDDKSDLTRLEDLSEFLHQDDPEVEAKLKAAAQEGDEGEDDLSSTDSIGTEDDTLPGIPTPDLSDLPDEEDSPAPMSLDDLEDSPEAEETSFGEEEPSFGEEETNWDNNNEDDEESSFASDEESSFGEEEETNWDDNSADDEESSFASEEESSFGEEEETNWDDNNADDEESSFASDEESSFGEEEETNWDDNSADDDESSFSTEEESSFAEEEETNWDDNSAEEDESDEQTSEGSQFQLPDPEELEKNYDQPDDSPYVSAAPEGNSTTTFTERENFQDLRDFGNAITYGVVKTGGNPPFSLILRNIKTIEDAEDIKIIMNEHGLVNPENEETIDQGLEQGSLLISQISEYSAIYLAHKMRRFDVELRIGLSDQLHPSKSYSREGRGLVSKFNLNQNRAESLETENHAIEIEDIKLATTPTLDGYIIRHYLQVITSHSLVEEDELRRLHQISNDSSDFDSRDEIELDNILDQFPKDELDEDIEHFDLGLNEVYKELVEELRNQAYKLEANAVVGINFNITPMAFQTDSSKVHYKITCSGNAVWVVDHQ